MTICNLRVCRGVMPLMMALVMHVGCAGRHGTPAGFSPQWDKLVVEVARFDQDQPTGVAVSADGRVFACFPRWSYTPQFAVAEIMPDGSRRPYPSASWNAWSRFSRTSALRSFVCAQALHVDADGFLWILDSGNPDIRNGVVIAGPKLFKIDLSDDTIAQVYYFDHERDMSPHSYLSDFAIDTTHQFAYVTDSQGGSLFIVDLRTRAARSVLVKNASTIAEPGISPRIGSEQWRGWFWRTPQYGANAIALSPDGEQVYYAPMTGRTLYRIPAAMLRVHNATDEELATHVRVVAQLPSIIDGMYMAKNGMLYMTALEKDAIIRMDLNDPMSVICGGETFVADPRLQWPDSLAMGADGYLYFTASMTHLRFPYRNEDRTQQPFYVLKASIANVARAAKLQRDADAARAQAADAQTQASEAARAADAREQVAAARHREAVRRQEEAARADQDAAQAVVAADSTIAVAQRAAAQQADIAANAAELAELAKIQAAQSQISARDAAAAAAEAVRLAATAVNEMNRTREALAAVAAGDAQAAAARTAHAQAVAAAESAQAFAARCQQAAAVRRTQADAAMADADAAAKNAKREVALASQLATRATALHSQAQAIAADALDAELVEITARTPSNLRTVDVPTNIVD